MARRSSYPSHSQNEYPRDGGLSAADIARLEKLAVEGMLEFETPPAQLDAHRDQEGKSTADASLEAILATMNGPAWNGISDLGKIRMAREQMSKVRYVSIDEMIMRPF